MDTEARGGRPFCAGEELSSAVHGGRDTGPGPLGWGDPCLHMPHPSASNASRSWRPGRLPRSQKPAVVTVCCPCHAPVTLASSGQEGGCSATVHCTGQRPAELPRALCPAAGSAGLRRWRAGWLGCREGLALGQRTLTLKGPIERVAGGQDAVAFLLSPGRRGRGARGLCMARSCLASTVAAASLCQGAGTSLSPFSAWPLEGGGPAELLGPHHQAPQRRARDRGFLLSCLQRREI